jgi:shikimate kinase
VTRVTRPTRSAHLVLVGMMGAGKTTTALALRDGLGWPVRDCDLELERRTGRTGAALVAAHGVEHLHRLEAEILLDALADDDPSIITAAGSTVASARVRQLLAERATVVWLDLSTDELVVRMAAGDHRRLLDRDATEALLARRREHLAAVADLRLDARRTTEELVTEILRMIEAEPTPRRAAAHDPNHGGPT